MRANFNSEPKRNVQISYDASEGEGLLKPSECRHVGEGGWPNRHINFIVAKKFNLLFILLYLRYMWERDLVKNVIWRKGLKFLKKLPDDIWTFPRLYFISPLSF